MDSIITYLAAVLDVTEDELTPTLLKEYALTKKDQLSKIKLSAAKVTGLDEKIVTLESDRDTAQNQITDFEVIIPHKELEALGKEVELNNVIDLAKFGKGIFDNSREECIKNYKLTLKDGEDSDGKVISLINKADADGLEVYMKQYGVTALDEAQATCTVCGNGDNITFYHFWNSNHHIQSLGPTKSDRTST